MALHSWHVRPLRPADRPAFDALVSNTLEAQFGEILPPADLRACARASQEHQRCYVIDRDGALAGYALATPSSTSPAARSVSRSACGRVQRLYLDHARFMSDTTNGTDDERAAAAALVTAVCLDPADDTADAANDQANDQSVAMALYERWGCVDVDALQRCLSLPSGHGRVLG